MLKPRNDGLTDPVELVEGRLDALADHGHFSADLA